MKVETAPKIDHTPAVLDDAAKRLLKAASIMEERGHFRGNAVGPSGAVCVVAALTYADHAFGGDGVGFTYWTPVARLRSALGGIGIVSWSDTAPTDEVIAKLRAVALCT